MADTPRSAFPAIGENTTVKIQLTYLISFLSFLTGATVLATTFYVRQTESALKQEEIAANQKKLMGWAEEADRRLERIENRINRALHIVDEPIGMLEDQ